MTTKRHPQEMAVVSTALTSASGAIRITLHADGMIFKDVLVDTGSSITWLPAYQGAPSLRLAGEGKGRCKLARMGNFSRHYADGCSVSGVLCQTVLSIAGVTFSQVIGAATSIIERNDLQMTNLSMARGVLALSLGSASSIFPLLRSYRRGSRRLSLCSPRTSSLSYPEGLLVVGGITCANIRKSTLLALSTTRSVSA